MHSRLGYVRAFVSCCIYVRRYASSCLFVPPFIVGSVHYLLLPHAALSLGVEAGISPVSICLNMYENRVAAEVCVCAYIYISTHRMLCACTGMVKSGCRTRMIPNSSRVLNSQLQALNPELLDPELKPKALNHKVLSPKPWTGTFNPESLD